MTGHAFQDGALYSFVLARYSTLLKPSPGSTVFARSPHALLARRVAYAQDFRRESNRQEKVKETQTPKWIRQSLDDSIAFLREKLAKLQQDTDEFIDRTLVRHLGTRKGSLGRGCVKTAADVPRISRADASLRRPTNLNTTDQF